MDFPDGSPSDPYLRDASRLLRLAAHPLRLRILLVLAKDERAGQDLRDHLGGLAQESLRSHLNMLCAGGLLKGRSVGRLKNYALTSSGHRVVEACLHLARDHVRDETETTKLKKKTDRSVLSPQVKPSTRRA